MTVQILVLTTILLISLYVALTGRSMFPISNYDMFATNRFTRHIHHIEIHAVSDSQSFTLPPRILAPFLPHQIYRLTVQRRDTPADVLSELRNIYRRVKKKLPGVRRIDLILLELRPYIKEGNLEFERLSERIFLTVSDEDSHQ